MKKSQQHIKARRDAIITLISSHAIEDQRELAHLLADKFNIHTTQAALSRDLKSLHIVKKIHNGTRVYALSNVDVQRELLKKAITDIRCNEHMVVIATLPGLAAFVGDWLDTSDLPILGCIAGENVVFLAPRSVKEINSIMRDLHTLCSREEE